MYDAKLTTKFFDVGAVIFYAKNCSLLYDAFAKQSGMGVRLNTNYLNNKKVPDFFLLAYCVTP